MNVITAAVKLMTGMATFDEARVSRESETSLPASRKPVGRGIAVAEQSDRRPRSAK
jgi:hypothetical protein